MSERVVSGELGQLVITSTHDDGERLLVLVGELDLASTPLLERELIAAEAADGDRVVVDLSGLEFIDSTGLGFLVAANRRSRESGRAFSLVRGPTAVHRVFELTQTIDHFQFER